MIQSGTFVVTKDSKSTSTNLKDSAPQGTKAPGQARRSLPNRGPRPVNGGQKKAGQRTDRQKRVLRSVSVQEPPCNKPGTAPSTSPVPDDLQLALMNKALGHPVRLKILRMLIERRACITGDLVAEFPLAQSTVSEHLRILKEAGLIQGEIEGPRTSYCVRPEGLALLKAGMDALLTTFCADPSYE